MFCNFNNHKSKTNAAFYSVEQPMHTIFTNIIQTLLVLHFGYS